MHFMQFNVVKLRTTKQSIKNLQIIIRKNVSLIFCIHSSNTIGCISIRKIISEEDNSLHVHTTKRRRDIAEKSQRVESKNYKVVCGVPVAKKPSIVRWRFGVFGLESSSSGAL